MPIAFSSEIDSCCRHENLQILNIKDYERLTKGADARAIGSIDTMSDALFADMERVVEQYAEDDEVGR